MLWFSLVRYFVGFFVFAFLKAELRATENIFFVHPKVMLFRSRWRGKI